MVIDHINVIWFGEKVPYMNFIGRGTFPLFCYAVALAVLKMEQGDAAQRKEKLKKYALRLLVLALVTEPVYRLALGGPTLNVIFTLLPGALCAALTWRLRPWQMYAMYAGAIVSMLWLCPLEFGLSGVFLPSALLLALKGKKSVWPFLFLLLATMNLGDMLTTLHRGPTAGVWLVLGIISLSTIVLPFFVLEMAAHIKPGARFMHKYALYLFYPGHLAVLKLAAMFLK